MRGAAIAYIDMPLRGQSAVDGHEILIIALVTEEDSVKLVYIDEDGSLGQAKLSEVRVNWRFDDRKRLWIDVDTGEDLGSDDGDS